MAAFSFVRIDKTTAWLATLLPPNCAGTGMDSVGRMRGVMTNDPDTSEPSSNVAVTVVVPVFWLISVP